MLSTKTLSFVAVFLSPLISAGLTPPTLNCGPNINAPNCLVYNAITIYVNQYAGTISANAFSKLQATLSGTPAASLNNVMSPLVAAFNSGALAASQQSLTVADQVQRCIDTIVASNGTASGWQCQSNSVIIFAAVQGGFNSALEAFVGFLPPNVYTAIVNIGVAQFANLDAHSTLPPTAAILSGINLSLISVVAGASANTVTGVERFEACVPRKIAAPSISCFAGPSSPYVSITTITAGILEQFVGTLPNTVVRDVINILAFFFSLPAGPLADMQASIALAILSVTANSAGSASTYGVQLQQCISNAIMAPSFSCVGPTAYLQPQILLNGVLQQFFGYLPANVVIDLESTVAPYLAKSPNVTQPAVQIALQTVLKTHVLGPNTVTCVEELQNCLLGVFYPASYTCNVSNKCSPILS